MRRPRVIALFLVLFLIAPALAGSLPGFSYAAAPQSFANSQFEQVWARTDSLVASGAVSRSWLWGPAPGEVRTEPFAGVPGGSRTVQYFDKARMEINPAVTDPSSQWATTTGLLVVELVSGKLQTGPNTFEQHTPAAILVAGDTDSVDSPLYSSFAAVASLPGGPDRRAPQATGSAVTASINRAGSVGTTQAPVVHYTEYFAETGHNVPDVFQRFMQTRDLVSEEGSLQQGQLLDPVYVLGYPITEAYWTTVPISGKATQVLVQLYQRRVLTYIPSFTGQWQVQMGNVGQHYHDWRYAPQVANPLPTVVPLRDTFVHVDGSKLTYAGQPVILKGTNYWLHTHPFVGTWIEWDAPTIRAELDKARQLGVNTIRIGLPYDNQFALETVWGPDCDAENARCDQVKGPIVNEMTQFLQIASGYNMKVLFALFDWSGLFPAANTPAYAKQLNYLSAVVTPFANDDRVLGWDLHNEPDNYDVWTGAQGPGPVITWAENIARVVHSIDVRHPITIGMANYRNLFVTANGKSMIDISDFVSFHCYDAGGLRTQIDAIQAHTKKPVLLEEMGWPTGPAKLSSPKAVYDEPTQEFLYKAMIGDVKASGLAGLVQWTLQDNPLGTDTHYIKPTYESWFGLVRLDGSFKPASVDFRDSYPVAPLPSTTTSALPLTKVQVAP